MSTLPPIVVRPLAATDVPHVRTLHSAVLPINYPPSFFLQLLLLPARICLVAHHPATPHNLIAFISACIHSQPQINQNSNRGPEPRIEILTLGVLPAYQNCGLARHLIRCTIQSLFDGTAHDVLVQAHVAASNAPALKFYQRVGMHISSDVIPNMYRSASYGSRDAYVVVGRM